MDGDYSILLAMWLNFHRIMKESIIGQNSTERATRNIFKRQMDIDYNKNGNNISEEYILINLYQYSFE